MSWVERGLEYLLECGLHGRLPGGIPAFARDKVERILVVRKDNIGDVLCTTPALRALRAAFPKAFLAILVSEHCRPVLERNPDLDEIFTYTKSKHRAGWLGLPALWDLWDVIRRLRARRFDLAVSMGRPSSRSGGWLAYACGAPWRLGYVGPRLHPFGFFLNLGRDPGPITSHEVDGSLALLASVGVPPAGRELTLLPAPEAQTAIRRRLQEAGCASAAGLALVHISNRRESSRWPLASFARTADFLQERLGLTALLSWAPGDASNPLFPGDDGKAEEVARQMRTRPLLLPTPTLQELIAAMSLSDLILSTDGGPMHLAAALDVPQVVLFGKTGQAHWAPISEKIVILQRGLRADRISAEEVEAAVSAVMARWGRRAADGTGESV
ncbi:MAG TPA: glycosyltransferase family 9 protein [Candidatus Methylomirabilis sp.]